MRSSRTRSSSTRQPPTAVGSTARAVRSVIENLEGRRMLAASPYSVGNTPTFNAGTSNTANIKAGPLAKGGGALVKIYNEFNRFVKKGGVRARFESSLDDTYLQHGKFVGVTLRTRGSVDELTNLVKENDGATLYRSKGRKVVEAIVPIANVDNLAAIKNVMHIRPMLRAQTAASQGEARNLAEQAMKTDSVIEGFGVDGSGQTIGIISDSFDDTTVFTGTSYADDVDSGDLPAGVEVLLDSNDLQEAIEELGGNPYGTWTNEGRAMAQLIHDLAPGADLAFHTAGLSPLMFAEAIRALREQGNATVIVDDISFFAEPFFQPGVIDQAIDDVVADGANYFNAAGNGGYSGYQRRPDWIRDPENAGGSIVDWDPSRKGVDTRLDITINEPSRFFFQWDNAYDGVVGNVRADVDIYVYRKDALISGSIDNNFATGVPVEVFEVTEPGDYQIVVKTHSLSKGASLPSLIKFTSPGGGADAFDARTDVEYVPNNEVFSGVYGHAATRSGIAVGAVPYTNTEALGRFKDFENEDFSSGGTILHAFDANGNRLDEIIDLPGALVSGVDGTATTVVGTSLVTDGINTGFRDVDFSQFFGTSAAAPHVAALAALLREIDDTADPEKINNALIESAKQNPLNGTEAGKFDPQGGWGLVDGVLAASRLDSTVPTARIDVPASSDGLSSITVRFSEPVEGVDITDFLLTRDGTQANRFRGTETVRDTGDGKTYVIENLSTATRTLGTYVLRLRNSGTEIEDSGGNTALGQYAAFDVTLRAPGDLRVEQLGDGKIRLRFSDPNSTEEFYQVERATNPDFTKGIRRFTVKANGTTFSDSDIEPGTAYYYRIRGERDGKFGSPAVVSIYNGSRGEVFVDQSAAKFSGRWTTQASSTAWFRDYASASDTGALETDKANTATFDAKLKAGAYFAYVRYEARKSNATNARVEVLVDGEVRYSGTLDQTKRGSGWVQLTDLELDADSNVSVRISSRGANGNVVADAVRFLPAGESSED